MTASTHINSLADAIRRHDTTGCRNLLAGGADPNGCEREGFDQMLSIAVGVKAPLQLCLALLEHGAEVSPAPTGLPGPLQRAAQAGYLAMCKELIQRGASPNGLPIMGSRPLHAATIEGHFEICQYLLEAGADVHQEGGGKWTPLHHAAMGAQGARSFRICKLLVEAGAAPSYISPSLPHTDILRVSPFHVAVATGNAAGVDYFIRQCGESPSQKRDDGRSMMDLAKDDTVRQLIHIALTEESVVASIRSAGENDMPTRRRSLSIGTL